MKPLETLEFRIEDHVAIITLNRPESANGINLLLAKELMECATACHEQEDIRAVLLTANGKMFSAGGDLKSFASEGDNMSTMIKTLIDYMHEAITVFDRMQKPLIIAVNGTAAGAGFSIACAGDLVYASSSAKFTMAYSAAGLSPDAAGSYYLPRLIGLRKTQELMLTNRLLSAEEALAMGIVTDVIEPDELQAFALKKAKTLAKGATKAFGKIKHLLASSYQQSLNDQMAMESEGMLNSLVSVDGREGISAFLDKRRPEFTGK